MSVKHIDAGDGRNIAEPKNSTGRSIAPENQVLTPSVALRGIRPGTDLAISDRIHRLVGIAAELVQISSKVNLVAEGKERAERLIVIPGAGRNILLVTIDMIC